MRRFQWLASILAILCVIVWVGCGDDDDDDDDNNDGDPLISNEDEVSIPDTPVFSAKVDGKAWKAVLVTAQYGNAGLFYNLVVAGWSADGQVVSFSVGSATGGPGTYEISIGQGSVVFIRNEEQIFYGVTEGEVEISQINEKGAKGTFHFTATKIADNGILPGDTIEVANGVFNITYGENIPLP